MSLCALVSAILLFESCNSHTPVDYDNPHDPFSDRYMSPQLHAPFGLQLVSVTKSGIAIAWQDTNTMSFYLHTQSSFILERSTNSMPFVELARVPGDLTSFLDNSTIDTSTIYKYRIKLISTGSASVYSSALTVQYTVVDVQLERTLKLGRPVQAIAINPDGTMLGAIGVSMALRVWHLPDYTLMRSFAPSSGVWDRGTPFCLAFSGDNTMIAANGEGTGSLAVNVWHLSDGNLIGQMSSDPLSVCFSSGDLKIITGGWNGDITAWNISPASLASAARVFSENEVLVHLVYPTRDGTRLIVGGAGVRVLRSDDYSLIRSYSGTQGQFYAVSPDEKYLAYDGSVLSLDSGATIRNFTDRSTASAFTFDSRFLIGQSWDGVLFVGELFDGSIRFTKQLTFPSGTYPAVVCLPHSYEFIAVSEANGSIDQWVMKQGWTSQ
jgi:WD40 repeat protein